MDDEKESTCSCHRIATSSVGTLGWSRAKVLHEPVVDPVRICLLWSADACSVLFFSVAGIAGIAGVACARGRFDLGLALTLPVHGGRAAPHIRGALPCSFTIPYFILYSSRPRRSTSPRTTPRWPSANDLDVTRERQPNQKQALVERAHGEDKKREPADGMARNTTRMQPCRSRHLHNYRSMPERNALLLIVQRSSPLTSTSYAGPSSIALLSCHSTVILT